MSDKLFGAHVAGLLTYAHDEICDDVKKIADNITQLAQRMAVKMLKSPQTKEYIKKGMATEYDVTVDVMDIINQVIQAEVTKSILGTRKAESKNGPDIIDTEKTIKKMAEDIRYPIHKMGYTDLLGKTKALVGAILGEDPNKPKTPKKTPKKKQDPDEEYKPPSSSKKSRTENSDNEQEEEASHQSDDQASKKAADQASQPPNDQASQPPNDQATA